MRLDIASTLRNFERAKEVHDNAAETIPFHPVFDLVGASQEERASIEEFGLQAIKASTVGAIILSGGQGTRLGFDGPKGMYNIGLLSGKCIFQIHVERIDGIRHLCRLDDGSLPSIPIYIMTSDFNHKRILSFFSDMNYFGYPPNDIYFFEQSLELCLSKDGKIIIESPSSLSLAPDGNGGIYNALRTTGAMEDIQRRGLMHLHAYGIDNVLTKSIDPAFIGMCIRDGADCGNKVVQRLNKDEKVGVTVLRNGKMFVAEYSELPPSIASSSDPETGLLLFNAANICNHYFSVSFLINSLFPNLCDMYHLASKKIPYMNKEGVTVTPSTDNGYKLEMFIFDSFPYASRFSVMNSLRIDEFAPVKNHPSSSTDTPTTACAMITHQVIRWLETAGAHFHWKYNGEIKETFERSALNDAINRGDVVCEISPLVSYAGEGLERFRGSTIVIPFSI